jgi:hypothetical protein
MIRKEAFLFALGALTGCVSSVPPDEGGTPVSAVGDGPGASDPRAATTDPAEALAEVDQNLARLRALQVFEVGGLLVDMPKEATNCYGPCPGSEKLIEEAKRDAALRLANLTAAAETAVKTPAEDACAQATIDANLAALAALSIVGVDGLVVVQPKNQQACYNLPCPEDIEQAKAATCENAGALAAIVASAKGL